MYGFVITAAGQSILTRAAAGELLTITGVQVGKGVVASQAAALALTALIEPVANATSSEPAVSANQLSMIVEYRNDMNGGLDAGFDLSEFGVFASVGDDVPTLMYYASLGDSPQPVQPESAGLDVHRFPIAVAVTGELTVTLGYPAGAFVTADALEGYVPIGADGKISSEYLPAMDYLPKTGGTMTGPIAMSEQKITGLGAPTADSDAARKYDVDQAKSKADAALPKTGGTMQGAIAMGGNKITGLGAPTVSTDAVRKQDVDTKAPVASPTFTGTPKAPTGTDYGTSRIRNISAGTTDLEAGVSTLASGALYFVYE